MDRGMVSALLSIAFLVVIVSWTVFNNVIVESYHERIRSMVMATDGTVREVASDIIRSASERRIVYKEATVFLNPNSTVTLKYACPLGAKVRIDAEPLLELVSHTVSPRGECMTVLRNPWEHRVKAEIVVYSEGRELLEDESYRVYSVLTWVYDNLRYIHDSHSGNTPAPPAETLRRGGGKCGDIAVAAAALLRVLGVRAGVAIVFPWGLGAVGHMAVAVRPESPFFTVNLRVYAGVSAELCPPVVVEGHVLLDPVLGASSVTPWCVPYSVGDVRLIVSDDGLLRVGSG